MDQLRAKKAQYQEFLEEVTIKQFRGISNLRVPFDFPVTVIAGPNGCGKSTALFACASAYNVPGTGNKDFAPAAIFPNLKASSGGHVDSVLPTSLQYNYIHKGVRMGMTWTRINSGWNKSSLSPKGSKQPIRNVYLRKLSNFTSPSEIKSVLSRSFPIESPLHNSLGDDIVVTNKSYTPPPTSALITSDLIAFAQSIMPNRYKQIHIISKGGKDLLFADREDQETKYSEFHMSAGERAILRISKDISNLKNALILIDEIEAGLHPYTQQQLMLELQRLALRNDLQIIVTTHSPVILECVPVEARIFFERREDNVIIKPPYWDIIQKAFYGKSLDKLSVLCEDTIAEFFLYGVMDVLNPRLGLIHDDIVIGRDTGKDMFSQHIEAIAKFNQLDDFIFVLDGDAKYLENDLKSKAEKLGKAIQPLFLPGDVPERWAWQLLNEYAIEYAPVLGMDPHGLKQILQQQDQLFNNAADKPTEIMKNKYRSFCEIIHQPGTELMRKIARKETEREYADLQMRTFIVEFEMQLRKWQSRSI